ncbi:hypothetical protein HDV00_003944 [Rhizophlyctis rosea]|nr:hypothetical protein HDV00_003944 [Rhizophlyctis rosea]
MEEADQSDDPQPMSNTSGTPTASHQPVPDPTGEIPIQPEGLEETTGTYQLQTIQLPSETRAAAADDVPAQNIAGDAEISEVPPADMETGVEGMSAVIGPADVPVEATATNESDEAGLKGAASGIAGSQLAADAPLEEVGETTAIEGALGVGSLEGGERGAVDEAPQLRPEAASDDSNIPAEAQTPIEPTDMPPDTTIPSTPEGGIPPTPSTASGSASETRATTSAESTGEGVAPMTSIGAPNEFPPSPTGTSEVRSQTTTEGDLTSTDVQPVGDDHIVQESATVIQEGGGREGSAASTTVTTIENAAVGIPAPAQLEAPIDSLQVADVGPADTLEDVGEILTEDVGEGSQANQPASEALIGQPSESPTPSTDYSSPSPPPHDHEHHPAHAPAPPAAPSPLQPPGALHTRLEKWYRKRYIGGFRNRQNGVEYFHAETQTPTPMELKAMTAPPKYHRDTQTKFIRNRVAQSTKETATQMPTPRLHISTDTDVHIYPHTYTTAAEHEAHLIRNIIRIQCWVRRVFAGRLVRTLRSEREERARLMIEKERRRKELADRKRRKEVESRLHPKSRMDFEILYNGLENWRQQETAKINAAGYSEPARLAALADLLDQEAALIQKIDRLRIAANEENRDRRIVKLLDVMSSPRLWPVHTTQPHHPHTVHVDTPSTIRARELKDLYHALNVPLLSVDERLQILLHVKYTVKEFDCNLTREIVELIDREGDLVSRGRESGSLEGLRRRISNLFMQFIQTPEFNPEAASYQKFPQTSALQTQHVYYCRSCTRYLPSTQFYLSTTLKHLGKCKDCTAKENIATQRKDDSSYADMLKLMRIQEAKRRIERAARASVESGTADTDTTSPTNPYTAISLLQESDLRYLVDQIWSRQSAISATKDLQSLILTRWNPAEELSPWNCILLTKQEAATHDAVEDAREIYSEEFGRRVEQRHLVARRHFGQLPGMERYLRRVYGGEKVGERSGAERGGGGERSGIEVGV